MIANMKATAARVKLLEDFTMADLQTQIDDFLATLAEATFLSIQYQIAACPPPYGYHTVGETTAELAGDPPAWTGDSTVDEVTTPEIGGGAYTEAALREGMLVRYSVLILYTE
jgi:hypothetical protein